MYKEFLLKKCLPYKALGKKILNDGTELFGNDKNIAPQAWLHQIYPPLNKDEINSIEIMIGLVLPNSLADFYYEMNGFSIFIRRLSIDGLRKDFSISVEASWQPFSIETVNKKERPLNAKKEDVFIGFYSENGNLLYINSKDERVFSCTVDDAIPLKTWNNFKDFFVDEVTNFFSKYDLKYCNVLKNS